MSPKKEQPGVARGARPITDAIADRNGYLASATPGQARNLIDGEAGLHCVLDRIVDETLIASIPAGPLRDELVSRARTRNDLATARRDLRAAVALMRARDDASGPPFPRWEHTLEESLVRADLWLRVMKGREPAVRTIDEIFGADWNWSLRQRVPA